MAKWASRTGRFPSARQESDDEIDRHPTALEILALYDDSLPPPQALRLLRHLVRCESCRSYAEDFETFSGVKVKTQSEPLSDDELAADRLSFYARLSSEAVIAKTDSPGTRERGTFLSSLQTSAQTSPKTQTRHAAEGWETGGDDSRAAVRPPRSGSAAGWTWAYGVAALIAFLAGAVAGWALFGGPETAGSKSALVSELKAPELVPVTPLQPGAADYRGGGEGGEGASATLREGEGTRAFYLSSLESRVGDAAWSVRLVAEDGSVIWEKEDERRAEGRSSGGALTVLTLPGDLLAPGAYRFEVIDSASGARLASYPLRIEDRRE